jgi:hypothetical protein
VTPLVSPTPQPPRVTPTPQTTAGSSVTAGRPATQYLANLVTWAPPRAADNQSTDGPGSLQLSPPFILKAGPAGGLRSPSGPAATRRSPGNRPHPPHRGKPKQPRGWEGRAEPWTSRTRGPQQTVMSAGFQVRADAAGLRPETAEVALGSPKPSPQPPRGRLASALPSRRVRSTRPGPAAAPAESSGPPRPSGSSARRPFPPGRSAAG